MTRVQAGKSEGVGLEIPERETDCAGRPSWYPFQINVCDSDEPDPTPLAGRRLRLPDAPEPPSWLY